MPISNLLWACPLCGEDRALQDGDVCGACGAAFRRGPEATIIATALGEPETTASAAEWLARLPDPASLLGSDPIRSARAEIREVVRHEVVSGESGYLNRIEVLGDPVAGSVRLTPDRLIVEREGGSASRSEEWPLETLTAVQTSSSSLQLKRRDEPLASFRFLDDALYLWEQLIRAALRDFYGRTGRGVIREFQPRIVAR